MTMIIAESDNRTFFFQESTDDLPVCPTCTLVSDREWVNPTASISLGRLDYSMTFDGARLVSEEFRRVVEPMPSHGCRFEELPRSPGVYLLVVDAVVRLDAERAGTKFGPACPTCGQPSHVIGPGKVPLVPGEIVGPGFCRTDVAFGDSEDYGRSPCQLMDLILVPDDVATRLIGAGLSGVLARPAAGP